MSTIRKKLTKADLHRAEEYIERLRKRADKDGNLSAEWHLNCAGVNVSDAIKYIGKKTKQPWASKTEILWKPRAA
jgi:hypothetical protein